MSTYGLLDNVVLIQMNVKESESNETQKFKDFIWKKKSSVHYHIFPKFSDRQVWANSADPDQTAQGLHCLQFSLLLLDTLRYGKSTVFKF